MSYEHCFKCDALTSRSLYYEDLGPFCEDCYETWPGRIYNDLCDANRSIIGFEVEAKNAAKYMTVLGASLDEAAARAAELEALIIMLYGRVINDEELTADEASDLSGVIESIRGNGCQAFDISGKMICHRCQCKWDKASENRPECECECVSYGNCN